MYMATQRKTILVVHPDDPAGVRRLLGTMGHVAVSAGGRKAALKALGTVRFDVVLTSVGGAQPGSLLSFVQELRLVAPGTAVVGFRQHGPDAANEAWMKECDATIRAPLSPSRVQWALDFELRYSGN